MTKGLLVLLRCVRRSQTGLRRIHTYSIYHMQLSKTRPNTCEGLFTFL
jgi:hypothetical protein